MIARESFVWDRTREYRPAIYDKVTKGKPLCERLQVIEFGRFAEFFRKQMAEGKPEQPMTCGELNRLAHAANIPPVARVRMGDGYHVYAPNLFAVGVVLRELHLEKCMCDTLAVELALDRMHRAGGDSIQDLSTAARTWASGGHRKFCARSGWTDGIHQLDAVLKSLAILSTGSGLTENELLKQYDFEGFVDLRLFDTLKGYFGSGNGRRLECSLPLDRKTLLKFAEGIRGRGNQPGLFYYPFSGQRLTGIFRGSPATSYVGTEEMFADMGDGGLFTLIGGRLYKRLSRRMVRLRNAVAAISMYPWEADDLEKAAEMGRRGMPVASPLGRLMVDDFEFALFEWVSGTRLDNTDDPHIWREYGSIVRQCHDRGIALDDAAGRNAIWSGDGIRLIDFEHTVISEKAEALGKREREPALERMKEELGSRKAGLLDAFLDGYRQARIAIAGKHTDP